MYIFPKPKQMQEENREFFFGPSMVLTVSRESITKGQCKLFSQLFKNFTCGTGRLHFQLVDEARNTAIFAKEPQALPEANQTDWEYTLKIDEEKAVLTFTDGAGLAHALFTLLSLIEARTVDKKLSFTLPVCCAEDKPSMDFRGIHICVFPETSYFMLKKFIRMAGIAKYSHIIIEFWGMFRYKCCPGMSRKNAFSHRQVKALVAEANAMGMQVIPMLNCLGHAAQNRAVYCKHAALDQNPKLAPYFEPDGWTWNLQNPDTLALLKEMRRELIEVCGQGDYFHIGCDEAFPYGTSRLFNGKDKLQILIDYLNGLSEEMKGYGRRALMWGDQMLYLQKDWAPVPANIAYAESQESADRLLAGVSRDIIITDWQYYATEDPMPTSKLLSDNGFSVILAPFNHEVGTKTCVNNTVKYGYMGLLQTTWHVMHGDDTRIILRGGDLAWNGNPDYSKMDTEIMIFQVGAFQRKLLPSKGRLGRSGLRRYEIDF